MVSNPLNAVMSMTKTERICWLWVVGILSFVLFLAIRAQDSAALKTLKKNTVARQQVKIAARHLVEKSKDSGKKEWVLGDPDFPPQVKALGVKRCKISTFGSDQLVLKLPVGDKRTVVAFPSSSLRASSPKSKSAFDSLLSFFNLNESSWDPLGDDLLLITGEDAYNGLEEWTVLGPPGEELKR